MDKTEKRIKAEVRRLTKIFDGIEEKRKATTRGLIERAAFMRVSLEDLEEDLNEGGFIEQFQQGRDQDPYERERPAARIYNSLNGGYQKIIKQLTDLLPKEKAEVPVLDEFEGF